MANYSVDPVLREMAKGLSNIRWNDELSTDEKAIVVSSPGRNLTIMPDGITHAVRMYLGGSVRTLGVTRSAAAAFRFADLALHRFWKYRQRGRKPPGPGDLNFSTARLQADLAVESEAIRLLDALEAYLVANAGLIERSAAAPRQSRSRISELAAQVALLKQTVEEYGFRLAALENKTPAPDGSSAGEAGSC